MKHVLSVSLGSTKRDHVAEAEFLGEPFRLERKGTDGDLEAAEALIQDYDGKVEAIGLGGIDIYLVAGPDRYTIRDGLRLQQAARKTPVVDGSGIKNTLERDIVRYLATHEPDLVQPAAHVLMVSAFDRFGMAEAFTELGCSTVFGDLMFSGGIPYPITTMAELQEIARKVLPETCKLPFTMLYPTGDQQERTVSDERFREYYDQADIIAGDWHFLRKYMPESLAGKVVLTNTTTAQDVTLVQSRGVRALITTTPEMGGRSFGTNLIEAAIVAVSGQSPDTLAAGGYGEWLRRVDLKPRVTRFGGTQGV